MIPAREARSAASSFVRSVSVLVAGLLTCALTIALAFALERWLGFAAHTFMLWFIIPVGGLMTSALAISGVAIAAPRLHVRVGNRVRMLGVVLGLLTFLGVFLLEYVTSSDQGIRLRDVVAFPNFLRWRLLEGTSELITRTGARATIDNGGTFGMVRLVLQVLSFALGPLAVLQKETTPSQAASQPKSEGE